MEILDPYKRLEEFRKRLEKLLDSFEKREIGIFQAMPSGRMRAKKARNKVIYEFDLPGFAKNEIDVSVEGNSLVVLAKKGSKRKEKKEDYYYAEAFSQEVAREVPLPEGVDLQRIKAEFANGVLKVEVPLKATKKKKKKITVR